MTNDLVSHMSDRLTKFMFTHKAFENTSNTFSKGDKIVILNNGIDSFMVNKYKPGMIGYIDNIMHRYVGQPAEHTEYWATIYDLDKPVGRSRWNINDILPYSVAMKLFNIHSPGQSSKET